MLLGVLHGAECLHICTCEGLLQCMSLYEYNSSVTAEIVANNGTMRTH